MTRKERMRDLVIILPGILGSVLQKDGQDLWSIEQGPRMIGTCLSGLNLANLEQLKLENDDADDLEDGIEATRLISVPHWIAGLSKIDGYSKLSNLIVEHFQIIKGDISTDSPANFFEFPYDWRRDNRVAARQLHKFVAQRLPQWREFSGAKDAKVILLAHSMGGLVARYYLEVLEGWQDCRTLITFGTPYRGSVKAANFLVNGYKKVFLELTEVVRSFTSVYQLLPIYKMLKVDGVYRRIAETQAIPNLIEAQAEKALAFHREIEMAVNKHQENDQYWRSGYKTIPIVGVRQDTLQSAEFSNGQFTVSHTLPDGIDSFLEEGDGTVPRLSAIPIELDQEFRETYLAEQHSYLQSSIHVLEMLRDRLKQMQLTHKPIRGAELSQEAEKRAAINLNLDDLYRSSEPILLRAKLSNMQADSGTLTATVTPISAEGRSLRVEFTSQSDERLVAAIDHLSAGAYRVEVQTRKQRPFDPLPVHDLFEVVN